MTNNVKLVCKNVQCLEQSSLENIKNLEVHLARNMLLVRWFNIISINYQYSRLKYCDLYALYVTFIYTVLSKKEM